MFGHLDQILLLLNTDFLLQILLRQLAFDLLINPLTIQVFHPSLERQLNRSSVDKKVWKSRISH